jgi:uncharacterized protein
MASPLEPAPKLVASSEALPAPPEAASPARLRWAALFYAGLMAALWLIARFFHLPALEQHPASTFLSFALLFAPYWLFGFGLASQLKGWLPSPAARIGASLLLVVPYFVLAVPQGIFQWPMALVLVAAALGTTALLHYFPQTGNWADWLVLAVFGLTIDLGWLGHAWPFPHNAALWPAGLSGFPKLMLVNVALYGYLFIKPLEGMGYDLWPRWSDFKTGWREFVFYTPIVLPLGFALSFIHFHRAWPPPFMVPAAWTFTFFFIALPEELYFRGLLQNLLERRWGRGPSLCVTAVLFGLSHFNKGAVFNWRYVLLATIAGLFYGRAWRERCRLMASSVTHASVDAVWSLWFR